MIPARFDYHRAGTVDEALSILEDREDARPVAGGQSLVPAMKAGRATPGAVVDVGGIDTLAGIALEADVEDSGVVVDDDGSDAGGDDDPNRTPARRLSIGATTTYSDLLESGTVADHAPVLHEAVRQLGDLQVRNRGTLGGNLARAEPGADPPAVLVATGATLVAEAPDGERSIPAREFVSGDGETALRSGELLSRIEIPAIPGSGVGAYAKRAIPASGYAMVGVAVRLGLECDRVASASVAASGVADRPLGLPVVEDALTGVSRDALDDGLSDAAGTVSADVTPADALTDAHASGEFRVHLLSEYVERAVRSALESGPLAAGDGGEDP